MAKSADEARRKALLERAAALKKATIESKTLKRPPAKVLASKDPNVLRKIAAAKAAKSSSGSVKIVAKTADQARATANRKEELRLKSAKSGLAAKNTAAAKASMNKKLAGSTKPDVVKVNSNPVRTTPGISGKGGAMVGGSYRPMGGGGVVNQYNK